MNKLLHVVVGSLLLVTPALARADGAPPSSAGSEAPTPSGESSRDPYRFRPSVMAGLNQWVLFGGGNVAAQAKVDRWVFEYSHGQGLHLDRVAAVALTQAERDAGAKVAMVWTTGGGVGGQITPNLHVLLEVKAHRYEVEGAFGDKLRYTSFTVGPGVFYDLYLYKGLFVQPNLRWWPTVASSYHRKGTLARADGSTYEHERHDLLPFVNVNIGWTFDGR